MAIKRPEGWKPKRPARMTECLVVSCGAMMYTNAHHCPQCGGETYAFINAQMRKHLKGR